MAGLLPPGAPSTVPLGGAAVPTNAEPVREPLGNALIPVSSVAQMQEMERFARPTQPPVIVGQLAAHVRKCWDAARTHKEPIERLMNDAQAARRGEYTDKERAAISQQGGSSIYMMLTATKARQCVALLRDALVGTGGEKPWTLRPSPVADMPPDLVDEIMQGAAQKVFEAEQAGLPMDVAQIREMMREAKDAATRQLQEQATLHAERAEAKMEDQLVEGGFLEALWAMIDDLPSFKTAFVKGPVVRRKPAVNWIQAADGTYDIDVQDKLTLEWERVDPYDIYPAPHATTLQDGYLIEHHKLTRQDLHDLIGVQGYDEKAIRAVLDEFGRGGLREWTVNESARGPDTDTIMSETTDDTIAALQYWGSVQGRCLREWGMSEQEIPDELAEYPVEAWLIGTHVIRAALNPDPLRRRPYYGTSYEPVPGQFWGNCLWDLIKDCQSMCNAAARSLANNLGIASGPQVWVNIDRLPPGESVSEMFPWKIWQGGGDPMGNGGQPIVFFQPESHAAELMGVFERFSQLADEYSGIPRYMAGVEGTPGAGRTASGLSMMINNASKTIKSVVSAIDQRIIEPLLERLYYYNMRYSEDPDLKGDLYVVARGALSLLTK
ncbi:MAG: hypothetical protein M0R28_24370, partial [Pigmentiphaga sp.]|nr:hypothetical protein [Pigmentiphaga sp.]